MREVLLCGAAAALLLPALLVGCGETVEVGEDGNNASLGNNAAANNSTGGNNTSPDNNGTAQNNANANTNGTPTNNGTPGNNGIEPVACDACEGCVLLYEDADLDGAGAGEAMCATLEEGLAAASGDCAPEDATRAPDVFGTCGDNVDDNCDGFDESCPTTQSAGVQAPTWDCTGEAPSNVLAWARFEDGGGYFADGACFVVFEGLPGEFYTAPINLARLANGSTCSPGYDERMYAHLVDDPATCPPLQLIVHGPGEEAQPVSTECRRFLFHMISRLPHSYFGAGEEEVRRRLTAFDAVEISCSPYEGWSQFQHKLLVSTTVELNPGFVPGG